MAGAFYLFSVLTAVFGESFLRGKLAVAVGFIAISGMVAMTLLLYAIFKPVSRGLSLLAACVSLVGLTFEALRWGPRGVDIAVAIHGFYCLVISYLIFRSTYLPRILGVLMALAALGYLIFLSPPLADYLSPYNLVPGALGEASLTLWLLVVGVDVQRWKEHTNAARASIRIGNHRLQQMRVARSEERLPMYRMCSGTQSEAMALSTGMDCPEQGCPPRRIPLLKMDH